MRRRMRRRMVIGGMVILGVGYGAYKLTQSQVKQVETHTGKKAEDLSEEELENAMDEIGIEAQDPTDEEIAMLEAEEAKNPSVAPDDQVPLAGAIAHALPQEDSAPAAAAGALDAVGDGVADDPVPDAHSVNPADIVGPLPRLVL